MAITVISYPNNNMNLSFNEGDTLLSYETIKNLMINTADAVDDDYIEVKFNGETIRINLESECRSEPTTVYFMNSQGALDSIVFFKFIDESLTVKRQQYESNGLAPFNGFHQFREFNNNGRTKVKLNTGFIEEVQNKRIRELLLSTRVWLGTGADAVPVNVSNTSQTLQNRNKDRVIKYEMEFEMSYNEVATI